MEGILFPHGVAQGHEGLKEYRARGGYEALAKAIRTPPEDVVKVVSDAGLRGRGIRPRLINFRPPGPSGGPPPVRRGGRAPPVAPHRSAPPVSTNSCDGCSPGSHRWFARPPDRSHARTPLRGHTPR